MVRFKSSILFVVLMALIGCSVQLEPPTEPEPKREQKEDQRSQYPHSHIAQAQA
jgi:hypothetical protein